MVMLAAAMAALLALGAGVGGAHAAPAAASGAEAYGLLVDGALVGQNVPLDLGPISWAAQEYPPGADNPNETSALEAGPLPADGSVVTHVGVMSAGALADDPPMAGSFAEAADVALFGDGEVSLISADLVRAQSSSNCDEDPTGAVTFENLVVQGQNVGNTPAPNTVIDLQVIKIILNEQHPASDGRGFVVNAIHVVSTTTGAEVFSGDIIVSHAMSTVVCPNGAGSTGGENPVQITKDVVPSSTTAGQQVTYTATFTNDAELDCLVNEAIDHLPIGFTLVSTAGDLGDTSATRDRPGGGVDVLVGGGVTIPAGESATQTFVVKVGDNVAPGTYYNDVELFCGNLGNFLKGLDAPVEITAAVTPTTAAPTTTTIARAAELPETGGSLPVAPLLAVLGSGLALAVVRQRAAWAAASSKDL
jgi:uncharacterized repeat protein (TIGR01451 family)